MRAAGHFFSAILVLLVATMQSGLAQNITRATTQSGSQVTGTDISHKGQNTERDSDGDGISDVRESQLGTNPNSGDTDGDGLTDGVETAYGSNPLVQNAALDIVYRVTKLPVPAGYIGAEITDISNGDFATGYAYGDTGPDTAVRWNLRAGNTEIPPGASDTYAEAVNNSGVVVGQYNSGGGFRWLPGQPAQPIGQSSQTLNAWDVNSAGDVVGEAIKLVPGDTGAYLLKAGSTALSHLATLPEYVVARAMGINDKGQVGGMVHSPSANKVSSVVWNNGAPTLLEVLGSNIRGSNFVYGIGENGTVFGIKDRKARIWPPAGGTQILPTTPAGVNSYPWKMNGVGEIIGEMNGDSVIWRPAGQGGWTIVDINSCILDADTDIRTEFYAYSMNDQGQIAGGYYSYEDFEYHPVILTPMLRPSLAVDANRDGTIKSASEDDSDVTTADKPYRFWINDDIDKLHTFADSAAESMATVSETEQDDIGPDEADRFSWQADYIDGRIECMRDLEDFSRLWISTQGLNAPFKNGDLKLGLKWTDTESTTPAIQFYEPVETDGGLDYLTDDAIAADQILLKGNVITLINATTGYATAQISGSGTFVLPTSFFANLSEMQTKVYLLFEGCTVGKGQLELVILKQGSGGAYTEIGESTGVWMDLKKTGDMYEQWSVGNGSGSTPDAVAGRVASETGSGSAFSYSASSPEEQEYILFVHGWNMEKWEKERFAETAYKRLWWQGYKGRFGLFTWPTTNGFGGGGSGVWGTLKTINSGVNDGANFDRGEFSAWRSGAPLRQLMQNLNTAYGGKLYVFSHSMGGIVASEALRLQSDANGEQIASVYIASQAALSAHTYDGTLSEEAGSANAVQWHYDHPSVPGNEQDFGPQTPNIYRNWTAFVLRGSASSTKVVGSLVNFYNMNDWALAAPAWQYNQLTKPDWPDGTLQPWRYAYAGDPGAFNDVFEKTEGDFGSNLTPLHLGTRGNPQDRYEIMAFAAESRVKAFGATANFSQQGVTRLVDLQQLEGWSTDNGTNKAHRWHSGQFRSSIQQQKSYWKMLLSDQGFNISTTTLP